MAKLFGRRKFLGMTGAAAGAVGAASLTSGGWPGAGKTYASVWGGPGFGGPRQDGGVDWQEIDRQHKAAVDAFLANIGKDEGKFWGNKAEFTMSDDGYKVFDIVCEETDWETTAGSVFPAFTYNGTVPGPEIHVTEGDKVRVNVTNKMSESTGVHFHGVHVPNAVDGVPFITQPAIEPGTTFTYEFECVNTGSHMYHSHHNAAEQVVRGLMGAFIIHPKDASREPEVTAEYVMVLNDSGLGYTINGKSFPNTQPIIAKKGDRIRVRFMNEGLMIHPMHLHGMPTVVFARDGYNLPAPFTCDTFTVGPGERWDVLVDCVNPGVWAWHCHILTHAESRAGLHGMTTALVVQEE